MNFWRDVKNFFSTREMDNVLSKMQDAFFITVIALMVGGTAAINKAQAATPDNLVKTKSKAKNKATYRSYTIKGVKYHPLQNAQNFKQTGKASWYGPGFHGKRTSNGERYNMHALTAAHKTLPMGTMVRVSNLSNGKSIVVRINDRGPFHGNRIIDLSKAAATRLGFVNTGMANVRVESLGTNQWRADNDTAPSTTTPVVLATAKPNTMAIPAPTVLNETFNQAQAQPIFRQVAFQTASFQAAPKATPASTELAEKPATASALPAPSAISTLAEQAIAKQNPTTQALYVDLRKFANVSDASLFLLQTAERMGTERYTYPLTVEKVADGYSVRVGPFAKAEQAEALRKRLAESIRTAI